MNELRAGSCIRFVEVTARNYRQYRNRVRFFSGDGYVATQQYYSPPAIINTFNYDSQLLVVFRNGWPG